jgi:hypothetical protein
VGWWLCQQAAGYLLECNGNPDANAIPDCDAIGRLSIIIFQENYYCGVVVGWCFGQSDADSCLESGGGEQRTNGFEEPGVRCREGGRLVGIDVEHGADIPVLVEDRNDDF